MYCGQCGKKIMENMLFCPFCGAPVVIPEQDGPAEAAPTAPDVPAAPEEAKGGAERAQEQERAPQGGEAARAQERPVSLFEREDEPSGGFVPLDLDAEDPLSISAQRVEIIPREAEEAQARAAEAIRPEPPRRPRGAGARRPGGERQRATRNSIPDEAMNPSDMFMDGGDDEYDDFGGAMSAPARRYEPTYDFEEPEYGSFLQRHIRGVVGLGLILLLVSVMLIWAFSTGGQTALAKMNLAWRADAYADLGYEAYRQQSYAQAARYYERAFSIDDDNYEYAHSAMVAHYDAGNTESAAAMLKKCIEMNPDSAEPYREMLILYPDAQSRPWEIQELIRQGYERTGDAALSQAVGE